MNLFPYTNFHDINLDWIIKTLKQIITKLENLPSGSGGGAVDSVNGKTGTVILTKSDIGLSNVDNVQQYSASNPPPTEIAYFTTSNTSAEIENAYQDGKICILISGGILYYLCDRQNSTRHIFMNIGRGASLTLYRLYSCVSNVWTYEAIQVVERDSPNFTGTPTAPTAQTGTDTTQIATTAFVQAAIAAIPNANGEDF